MGNLVLEMEQDGIIQPELQKKARQVDEARLSAEEIAKIRKEMASRGLSVIYCQLCEEDMQPEQARREKDTGTIMCRPCYLSSETDADQDEIDLSIKEDFPG